VTNEELLDVIEKAAKDGVTSLNLSEKKLTTLPAEIGNLTHLTALDLYNNQLTALPTEIGSSLI
jgi:Leucine-rich repeat (LRR) protein